MKKSNKGFFLAETIVVIALVTTVMAFVYPNVTKLYDNYKNRTKFYDQTEDLYTLKAAYKYLINEKADLISNPTTDTNGVGCKNISSLNNGRITDSVLSYLNIDELYIVSYMASPSSDNYNFNKYLKRLKKTTYDSGSYRLIGLFKEDAEERYASIKIENPNPVRGCNLGGN